MFQSTDLDTLFFFFYSQYRSKSRVALFVVTIATAREIAQVGVTYILLKMKNLRMLFMVLFPSKFYFTQNGKQYQLFV